MEQLVVEELEAALRSRIIAAVQAELDRHAATVVASAEKLRADTIRERNDIYRAFGEQIEALTRTVEDMTARNAEARRALAEQLHHEMVARSNATESKVADAEVRLSRRVDEVTRNLDQLVEDAARPLMQSIADEQTSVAGRVEVLERDLRKFDEQAARMVGYFNDMSGKIQARAEETAEQVKAEVARQISLFDSRVEEVASSSLRQHVETSQLVTDRADRLEERVNVKISTIEGSIREDVGRRVAEIDAHVGRVSRGLDDTLNVLGDRMAAVEQWVRTLDERLEAAREEFASIDGDTLDDLKEKVSAAAGEAMLVRIDFEKFEEKTAEKVESANARLASVESQLADATMDVSTAIQLERLEELERAMIELDPSKFVMRSSAPPPAPPAPPASSPDDPEQRTPGGTT